MMTDTERDYARRLVKFREWWWPDGMTAIINGEKWITGQGALFSWRRDHPKEAVSFFEMRERTTDWIPDLSDSATQGCLVEMLREAGSGSGEITWGDDGWSVMTMYGVSTGSRGAALADALLRAWGDA